MSVELDVAKILRKQTAIDNGMSTLNSRFETFERVNESQHKHLTDICERTETQAAKTNGRVDKHEDKIQDTKVSIAAMSGKTIAYAVIVSFLLTLIPVGYIMYKIYNGVPQ